MTGVVIALRQTRPPANFQQRRKKIGRVKSAHRRARPFAGRDVALNPLTHYIAGLVLPSLSLFRRGQTAPYGVT